jgi:nucleoid-associated protein YgaU
MTGAANAKLVVHWIAAAEEEIEISYNPSELSFEKSVQLAEITMPGLNSPLQQFIRGQAEKFTVELFFDTTDHGMGAGATSVTRETDRVYALTRIEPKGHAPPLVSFVWGEAVPGRYLPEPSGSQGRQTFKGIVESVRHKLTLFSPDGIPLRAAVTLTIREFVPLHEQLPRTNQSSPDKSHAHVLNERETLAHVAAAYYLRPGTWRPIAEDNGIDDPRRLRAGQVLRVPALVGERRAP